jgi:hypothetical protein
MWPVPFWELPFGRRAPLVTLMLRANYRFPATIQRGVGSGPLAAANVQDEKVKGTGPEQGR